ncbi:MAG: prolyl oligopeptidase family serine peptidase [Microbacterium sp.]
MTVASPDVEALVGAWGSWSPTMTAAGDRVAYLSDRGGAPSVWVQQVGAGAAEPSEIRFTDDPVVGVSWSADGAWLACAVAPGGGVRQQVWVVRPDGTHARVIAGTPQLHAELGPWTRSGHHVVVTIPPAGVGEPTASYLADPVTGELHPLSSGALIHVLDVSVEERVVLLRDGERGRHFCVAVDRLAGTGQVLTAPAATGTTESGILRRAPAAHPAPLMAYLVTDVGRPRSQLLAVPLGPSAERQEAQTLAARDDAELEEIDADDEGIVLLLVWNVAGRTEMELLDTRSGARTPIRGLPGTVAAEAVLSRDGQSVFVTVESPRRPRRIWRCELATSVWSPVSAAPPEPGHEPVEPTLERFGSEDGREITGWLYRPPGDSTGSALVWLHGGPESQERPGYSAQHQALTASGICVFALNVRGSSGFGREFVHADERERRPAVFGDVRAAARHLVALGAAPAERIAVGGRSYGGYLALAMLAFSPGVFCAGIDVCGMSDLRTFYRDSEPWIAAAAYPKYGHPHRDRALLRALSPMRAIDAVTVPLLVVHGEHDTNVPVGEARQVVAALSRRGRPVTYLELPGEGHEYRRLASRERLLRAVLDFAAESIAGA